jgi:hypothetical protein
VRVVGLLLQLLVAMLPLPPLLLGSRERARVSSDELGGCVFTLRPHDTFPAVVAPVCGACIREVCLVSTPSLPALGIAVEFMWLLRANGFCRQHDR